MYSSNLKVDCDFRTIELLQMSISLKMCYVIITCNEVLAHPCVLIVSTMSVRPSVRPYGTLNRFTHFEMLAA
jgi:hypothetical protein